VFGVNPEEFLQKFTTLPQVSDCGEGEKVICLYQGNTVELYLKDTPLAVGLLQKFLDEQDCEIDYIHGADEVKRLSAEQGNVGFLLPKPGKSELFCTVIQDGALPRKTFSMGEANEKRFYMEAKRIK